MGLATGTRLGPYEILSPLGAGGMGEVYKARDTRLDRTVAVKVSKEQFSERFDREARAVAALNHPNICTLYDVGRNYLVMEHIEGEPLKGPLPLARALSYAAQICEALDAAHRSGIVHRDLKPANVMVTKAGIKLLDFGLAKFGPAPEAASDETLSMVITKEHTRLGTLPYMSPEQLQAKKADARSDIFSFGCVLYEMLTGKRFRDDPRALQSGDRLPAALDRVVKKCLAEDPDARWQTATDLGDELRWIASSPEAAPVLDKRPSLVLVAAGLALGLLLGAGAVRWLWRPAVPEMVVPRYLTYSGRDSSPALSPDGKMVAFVSDRDGSTRIWLKQVAGGSEVALTSGPDENPRFSPDSSTILFSRSDGPHASLYRVSSLGGEARKILGDAGSADFSPDGRRIAFLRWKSEPGESSIIGVTGVDGSGTKEIAEVNGLKMEFPRWSPDGTQIAMVGSPESDFRDAVLIVSEDGKNRRFVLPAGSGIGTTSAAWLSNDELIYLTGDANTGTPPTLVRRHIKSGATRSYPWAHHSTVLDVRPGGNLVFDAIPTRCSLRELSSTRSRWLARGNSADREPAYSPDGKRIVFASNRAGNMDIWTMSIDSGTVSRVTDHPGVDYDPAWSPDGKKVIWSSDRGGHFEIYQAEADGSGATRVTDDGKDAENPTMTRDGKWVIYASYHPNKLGIWKVHPDGSGAQQLAAGPYFNPEVSPDGEYALYLSSPHTDRNVIHVTRVADGAKAPFEILCEIRRRSRQLIGRARWMPDGKAIAFLGQDENGINGIYKQPFVPGRDTTSERSKLGGFDPDIAADSLGISPDGTGMIIAGWERTSSVMIAEQPPFLR